MKNRIYLLSGTALFALTLMLTGCGKKEEPAPPPPPAEAPAPAPEAAAPAGGEQKAGFSGNPVAGGAECPAGDHAVYMDMLAEILSPGMQDHGDTQLAAEPAGIAPKRE